MDTLDNMEPDVLVASTINMLSHSHSHLDDLNKSIDDLKLYKDDISRVMNLGTFSSLVELEDVIDSNKVSIQYMFDILREYRIGMSDSLQLDHFNESSNEWTFLRYMTDNLVPSYDRRDFKVLSTTLSLGGYFEASDAVTRFAHGLDVIERDCGKIIKMLIECKKRVPDRTGDQLVRLINIVYYRVNDAIKDVEFIDESAKSTLVDRINEETESGIYKGKKHKQFLLDVIVKDDRKSHEMGTLLNILIDHPLMNAVRNNTLVQKDVNDIVSMAQDFVDKTEILRIFDFYSDSVNSLKEGLNKHDLSVNEFNELLFFEDIHEKAMTSLNDLVAYMDDINF